MLALLDDEKTYISLDIGVRVKPAKHPRSKVVHLRAVDGFRLTLDEVMKDYEIRFRNYFGFAYSLCFSRDTANEIVQDVFARIVEKINREGYLSAENLEAYVIRSIRNEYVYRNTKEIKRQSLSDMKIEHAPSAEWTHITTQPNQTLADAIEALPQAQRVCLVMYYYNEMKSEDIARELGISNSAVKTHIKRARLKLEKSVGRTPQYDEQEES